MKVAICISGQPRAIRNGFASISKNLIIPNNADVFFHTWFDKDSAGNRFRQDTYPDLKIDPDTEDLLLELYKPKAYKIEKQKCFKNSEWDIENTKKVCLNHLSPSYIVDMMYCMWYSINQSNTIKEIFRLENDINYDYVIRCRFDSGISRPLICSEFNLDTIWLSRPFDPHFLSLDDWFALGSNDNLNVYASAFLFMDFFRKSTTSKHRGIWTNESLVYDIVNKFEIGWSQIPNFEHKCIRS
jgi:hypothetical protein